MFGSRIIPFVFFVRHKIPTYFDTYTLCIKGGFAGDLVPQEVGGVSHRQRMWAS